MDAIDLQQYIIDNNKIITILESLECHGIKEYKKDYRAGLKGHSNKTAISINKETLKIRIFTPDSSIVHGNIFSLLMHLNNSDFISAIKKLHSILDLKYEYKGKKKEVVNKVDPLNIFKKVQKYSKRCNVNDLPLYKEDILSDYIQLPYIDWIREGIMPWTCKEFKIGFSSKHKRIIIPERYWCGESNDYIGISGRTVVKEYKLLDIPKYLAIKEYPKTMNLYGLQENYKYIQEAGYVIVAESQKSVLKRHSLNDKTVVAVGSHEVSNEQTKILIGLNISIIIAFDKDIKLEHIRATCEKFYNIRDVYYVYDKYDLLKEKEAPMDAKNKIYNYLLKYKIKYDEQEHYEYLKWRKENEKVISGTRKN